MKFSKDLKVEIAKMLNEKKGHLFGKWDTAFCQICGQDLDGFHSYCQECKRDRKIKEILK